jgi:beta-N-acetylhexosaminidase
VDFSFAPVLDVDHGHSSVISDRAFHSDPQAIAELAHSLMLGLKHGGMHTVGKHFPGHGFVRADSHLDIPVDEREFVDIEMCDLVPFRQMVDYGLTAVMPAHVIYPRVDSRPAGFSPVWLKNILRGQLGFEGCIFSDDLSMEGATVAGGIVQRAEAALNAGCDMVLVCNKPESADELLQGLHWEMPAIAKARLAQMRGHAHPQSLSALHEQHQFLKALDEVAAIGKGNVELPLA